jgi:hypothetical protein
MGIGAPYPGAHIETPPEQHSCFTRYRASTTASIAQVAGFYTAEAARAGIPLADDTKGQFPDYRTLTFIAQPKFMFVLLDRRDQHTTIVVSFHTRNDCH